MAPATPAAGMVSRGDAGEDVAAIGSDASVSDAWVSQSGTSDGSVGDASIQAPDWALLSAGGSVIVDSTCAIRADHTVACWGGIGTALRPPSGSFVQVSVGDGFACALRTDGTAACWGGVYLDGGTVPAAGLAPAGTFKEIVAGGYQGPICTLGVDGTVHCIGDDSFHQAEAPKGAFVQISSNSGHACALDLDGGIVCWGLLPLLSAEPGIDPDACSMSQMPTASNPPQGPFRQVSVGWFHNCALRVDGTLACWGDDSCRESEAPSGQFVQVSVGEHHSCALRSDGTIACWGDDTYGQTDAPSGVFSAVAAGAAHTCAMTQRGGVQCWGLCSYDPFCADANSTQECAANDAGPPRWAPPRACAPHLSCTDGQCSCPAPSTCLDVHTLALCDPGGSSVVVTDCGNAVCVGGACCSGSSVCTDINTLKVTSCPSSGQTVTSSDCGNSACIKGQCVGVCRPGAIDNCSGTSQVVCNDMGQWDTRACSVACRDKVGCVSCADGVTVVGGLPDAALTVQTCTNSACVNGQCIGVCGPGAIDNCSGSSQVVCSDMGQWVTSACSAACRDKVGCLYCGDVATIVSGPPDAAVPFQTCTNSTCVGASCVGVCTAGSAGPCQCGSEVLCNASGQWAFDSCGSANCIDYFGCEQFGCGTKDYPCCTGAGPGCQAGLKCALTCNVVNCDAFGSCSCSGGYSPRCVDDPSDPRLVLLDAGAGGGGGDCGALDAGASGD